MTEQLEQSRTTRKWRAYVCPDCRYVFRILHPATGVGVVCSNCSRLLKVPTDEELAAIEIKKAENAEAAKEGQEEVFSIGIQEGDAWLQTRRSDLLEMRKWGLPVKHWIVIKVGVVLMLMMVFLIPQLMKNRKERPVVGVEERETVSDVFEGGGEKEPLSPELKTVAELTEVEILAAIEPVYQKFMAATTVEELLPLVRNRELVEGKIRAAYPDGKFPAYGYLKFNSRDMIAVENHIWTIVVANADYEEKALNFEQTKEGPKIDWESWVGWSEIGWKEFKEKRPQESKEFRVILTKSQYYNFGFTDEKKWGAYSLQSPDRKETLTGYVLNGGEVAMLLYNPTAAEERYFTVKLRYPEGGKSSDQVIIESIVVEGWVKKEE